MRPIRDDNMINFCFLVFMLSVFNHFSEAQRPGFGKCPDYPPMKDFDPSKFQGDWYEIERSFYILELPHSCVKFNFTLQDGLLKVAVFSHNRLTGRSSTSYGRAKPNYLWPAVLSYEVNNYLPPYLARMLPGSGKYLILDTDYDNFAILYSCSDLGILHADLLWILGRERDLTVDSRVRVYDHLINLNINTDRLTLTPQKKCPA
ncbi:apolipoprotein D-like [Lycorma delicatula]|uniref:apolipoprotein D-like n=1 Tax=Lycorma delicatula TaxID=130591 RepID=UPI003F50EE56